NNDLLDDEIQSATVENQSLPSTPTKKTTVSTKTKAPLTFSITPTKGKNKGKVVGFQAVVTTPTKSPIKIRRSKKKTWAPEVKQEVRNYFKDNINKCVRTKNYSNLPGKIELEECIKKLHLDRSWKELKDSVRNMVASLLRAQGKMA
ncbi:uncharacterized protein LOC113472703, partial [Diaphorina citri]|uniref:Uncharacterized protein LOC113472703 n=1 Tax=Diaphorina citri TaxID=121845 RepID=A0A3Q0JIS0_DIACI